MLRRSATSPLAAVLLMTVAAVATPVFSAPKDVVDETADQPVQESTPRIPLDSMTPGLTPTGPDEDATESDSDAAEGQEDDIPPVFLSDPSQLPEPVQRMRRLIMEAAKSGDITRFRTLLGPRESGTQLSFSEEPDDKVEYMRSMSGDEKGYEILAILLELLEAPAVKLAEGSDDEIYVWPYFVAKPLTELTPEQMVELMTLATAGDVEGMEESGGYNFFRVGISPEGEWLFFAAGD